MKTPLDVIDDGLPKLGDSTLGGTKITASTKSTDQSSSPQSELNAIAQREDHDQQGMGDGDGAAPGPGGGSAGNDPGRLAPERVPIIPVDLWADPAPPFCYLAGPAGCGKTFAVKDWQQRERGLMLLATTGIAAINLGGTTINAALGYFDTKSLQDSYTNGFLTARLGRLWRAGVKRLILDEVSMLDGDALTYLVKGIEEVNGRGYVLGKWSDEDDDEPPAMGLTLVGDFAQLPPVKAPFAWESVEWPRFAEPGHTITLTEIRRQSDPGFIEMLRAARCGKGNAVLDYMRGAIHAETDDQFEGPTLFAKNDVVDRYNWIRLGRVTGKDCYFESRREGDQRSEWGNPKKPPRGIPLRLHTKVGALMMVLANYREAGPGIRPFVYVNGDLGEVVDATETCCQVWLQRTGEVVPVTYVRREVQIPCDSARRKELRDKGQQDKITENGKFEITGWIEYMPLRVAYGSTVHKSQGLSLDRVQVNIRDAFFKSPGMLYVALSRARTAAGLRLVGSEAALVERCAADPRLQAWL
jgi:ATP-dependent DNA helicase PIF1